LSRKVAKSGTRVRGLRSTRTKTRTHIDRLRASNTDLEEQLKASRRELAEAREHLSEALEQQTATSEVLGVISSSPGDLRPVFQAMLENATRICEANFGNLYLRDGDTFRIAAVHNTPPAFVEARRRTPHRPGTTSAFGLMTRTKTVIHVADLAAERTYVERDPGVVAAVELAGVRTSPPSPTKR
jgi:hypothetical protein